MFVAGKACTSYFTLYHLNFVSSNKVIKVAKGTASQALASFLHDGFPSVVPMLFLFCLQILWKAAYLLCFSGEFQVDFCLPEGS